MIRLIAILAATGSFALTVTDVSARVPDKTILKWEREANAECRGGSGDEQETLDWCNVREALGVILGRRGWCYGREGEAGYQMEWHRCGKGSIHR